MSKVTSHLPLVLSFMPNEQLGTWARVSWVFYEHVIYARQARIVLRIRSLLNVYKLDVEPAKDPRTEYSAIVRNIRCLRVALASDHFFLKILNSQNFTDASLLFFEPDFLSTIPDDVDSMIQAMTSSFLCDLNVLEKILTEHSHRLSKTVIHQLITNLRKRNFINVASAYSLIVAYCGSNLAKEDILELLKLSAQYNHISLFKQIFCGALRETIFREMESLDLPEIAKIAVQYDSIDVLRDILAEDYRMEVIVKEHLVKKAKCCAVIFNSQICIEYLAAYTDVQPKNLLNESLRRSISGEMLLQAAKRNDLEQVQDIAARYKDHIAQDEIGRAIEECVHTSDPTMIQFLFSLTSREKVETDQFFTIEIVRKAIRREDSHKREVLKIVLKAGVREVYIEKWKNDAFFYSKDSDEKALIEELIQEIPFRIFN